jgi:endonuclease/exonuclease/phosphatase family metal-dependent hydrolase
MNLAFGSYNLEHGGLDSGDDARLRRQLAVLAGAQVDVWALQECNGWSADGHRALFLAERELGMRGFLARSSHHGCDLAVLVRESAGIRVTGYTEEGPPYWHAVAVLAVQVQGFGALRLASAHLAPSAPSLRLAEAEAFALIAEKGAVIAGGDWNAVPLGDPAPDTDGIDPGKARRKLDSRAAGALAEHLTDVAAHLGDTTPTVGHTRNDKLAYRCDRVYTTLPAAAITGYRVIHEDVPESDHRPVVATFALNG